MSSAMRKGFLACCVVGWAATTAWPIDITLIPVATSGGGMISGNEVTIDPGDAVLIEARVSNWGAGSEALRAVQIEWAVDGGSAGALSNYLGCSAGNDLCPICSVDFDGLYVDSCRNRCGGPTGSPCNPNDPNTCLGEGGLLACLSLPGFAGFPDFWGRMAPISGNGVGSDNPNELDMLWVGNVAVGNVWDGQSHYAGSLVLVASNDADGAFTVSMLPAGHPDSSAGGTFVRNANSQPFVQPTNLFAATVHVGAAAPPQIVHQNSPTAGTTPCSGYVDPRIENLSSTPPLLHTQGLNRVRILFDQPVFALGGGPVAPGSFVVTSLSGTAPTVASVTEISAGENVRFELMFAGLPPLQTWTTVRAMVQNASGTPILNMGNLGPGMNEPDRMDYAAHPGNVNQDSQVAPIDLLRFRQRIANACGACPSCGGEVLFFDMDRNTLFIQPIDLLRLRQVLTGAAPATRNWGMAPNNTLPLRP